ncbi:MAG: hypothetical protein ACQETH_16465 [Candidatus Rifleibacteriota bacterium]
MLNSKVIEQVSELMIEALSDKSIKEAEPMSDSEIKLLEALISKNLSESSLDEESTLISGPLEIINKLYDENIDQKEELQARKTLRRFFELFINLTDEPDHRILH